MLDSKVLVLNKSWVPIKVITVKKAMNLLFTKNHELPKAKIVQIEDFQTFSWSDWSKLNPKANEKQIKTAQRSFKLPQIILLQDYNKLPKTKVVFNRKNLFKRDECCQYCGKNTQELTIDHIIPKSKGGKTSWINCCLSCVKCNSKKANRTPEQAGMKLMKQPVEPDCNFTLDLEIAETWNHILELAYWNVELR